MPDPGEDVEQPMSKMLPASESSQYREGQVCNDSVQDMVTKSAVRAPREQQALGGQQSLSEESLRSRPRVSGISSDGEDSRCQS